MNKKTKKIAIVVITTIIIVCLILLLILNIDIKKVDNVITENEIVPEEEISDEQLRKTTLTLYYVGKNNEIKEEIRKVDSKKLIDNPYMIAMELLLEKPESNEVRTCIPENVKINNIEKKGECLVVDISKEFIDNMENNVEIQGLSIGQIVNTMTQFTEINAVKILIDGSDDVTFKNGNINFKQFFTNED
ncbi:MAG: GerMN domain-containing protein [Clostridia bacterium]|nr:GerMN domain-containing protein [Clostridia bacterium]